MMSTSVATPMPSGMVAEQSLRHHVKRGEGTGAKAPRMVAGAPLKCDVKSRLRWPSRMVGRTGIVVWGMSPDACAVATVAVDQVAQWRRAANHADRVASKLARQVAERLAAVEGLLRVEAQASVAGRRASWEQSIREAMGRHGGAVASLAEAREHVTMYRAARDAWAVFVILPDAGGEAFASDHAHVWAVESGEPISVRIRRVHEGIAAQVEGIRAKLSDDE
jgi:hypothetical protein